MHNTLMELVIIGLMILTAGFFAKALTAKVNIRVHCADLGRTHEWFYKDNGDGNGYLVCKVCKHLPGGDREEAHYYQHEDH